MSAKPKLTKYDELLSQVQQEALEIKNYREKIAEFEHRASVIVPRMFWALKEEGVSAADAKDRIEKDCVGVWKKGTIRDALPPEAKDPVKAAAGKLGREKQLKKKQEEEEAIRNKDVVMPTISGSDMMMSGTRLGEVDEDTFDKLYNNNNKVFEDDDADADPPNEDLYSEQKPAMPLDKALLADLKELKKENKELKKENVLLKKTVDESGGLIEKLKKKIDDVETVKKKLEHSVDILTDDLLKRTEERDHYKNLYEELKKK